MSRYDDMGLRILAQYDRRKSGDTCTDSLRVDGQGLIPRAGPNHSVRILLRDDPKEYRFPLPADFNIKKYFTIPAKDLPLSIPYDADVTISIIETDRRGERVLAQSPLRYRTV